LIVKRQFCPNFTTLSKFGQGERSGLELEKLGKLEATLIFQPPLMPKMVEIRRWENDLGNYGKVWL
jgi:hypothetical protein